MIDEQLITDVLRATGLKSRKEAVELGLRTILRLKHQEALRQSKGKLVWDSDLDDLRRTR